MMTWDATKLGFFGRIWATLTGHLVRCFRPEILVRISADEASRGGEFQVCRPEGGVVGVRLPPGIVSGTVYQLEDVALDRSAPPGKSVRLRVEVASFAMPAEQPPPRPLAGDTQRSARLRQDLLAKTLHSRELYDRLLEAERQRLPDAGELELLTAAIQRWERDNQ
jgi:hypothetical protein